MTTGWTVLEKEKTLQKLAADDDIFRDGGDSAPQFFIKGDGHGRPPFDWVNAGDGTKAYFEDLIKADKLYVHVEEHQDHVSEASVPALLKPLLELKKPRVIGWERNLFKSLQPVMESALIARALASEACLKDFQPELKKMQDDMLFATVELCKIDQEAMAAEALRQFSAADKYCEGVVNEGHQVDREFERKFADYLKEFNEATMNLRTDPRHHQQIGQHITELIKDNPECTHLITCGDAHLFHNPLFGYIDLPERARGWVDMSK